MTKTYMFKAIHIYIYLKKFIFELIIKKNKKRNIYYQKN